MFEYFLSPLLMHLESDTRWITCKAAALGFRELRVETKRSDAMAGGSDASGADVRHQPPVSTGYPNCLLLKKK